MAYMKITGPPQRPNNEATIWTELNKSIAYTKKTVDGLGIAAKNVKRTLRKTGKKFTYRGQEMDEVEEVPEDNRTIVQKLKELDVDV